MHGALLRKVGEQLSTRLCTAELSAASVDIVFVAVLCYSVVIQRHQFKYR